MTSRLSGFRWAAVSQSAPRRSSLARRVVAFDVLADFFACAIAQQPRAARALVRGLAAIGSDGVLDSVMNVAARRRPVVEWGLAQAMHVFGCDRPAEALRAMRALHTRMISARTSSARIVDGGGSIAWTS